MLSLIAAAVGFGLMGRSSMVGQHLDQGHVLFRPQSAWAYRAVSVIAGLAGVVALIAGFFRFGWLWLPAALVGTVAVQLLLFRYRVRWQGREPGEVIVTGLLGLLFVSFGWFF